MTHWDPSTDEWVMFKRGGVPHLKNIINNRLESRWGRIKEVVDDNFTTDQLFRCWSRYKIMLRNDFHRVGSHPPMAEDPELTALTLHLSEYAFGMVTEQHHLVVGPKANYDLEVEGEMTKIINPGDTHEVNARVSLVIFRYNFGVVKFWYGLT
ncbi:hypothetical protein PHMEG_00012880 [Phytophthora megakarya]|uniref:Uncharacterized protein n=1 Tax=Phytophthora megakarya TaxID=4795 RepID=A0A225W849_9STRA|nr:hypothetical protein PHMEG_00012880 [Phytophthora megakarya]